MAKAVLDPREMDGISVYKVLSGAVVPRPISLTSTISAAGVRNLAPFSFFNVLCHEPPLVSIAISPRGSTGTTKDTLNNLKEVGEFVVNIVSDHMTHAQNACAGEFAASIDEFDESGLTPVPSKMVRPPRVKESLVNFECRVEQILQLPESPSSLVIGRVCLMHVDEEVLDSAGRINFARLRAVGRLAGNAYCSTQQMFALDYDAFSHIKT